MYLQDQLFQGTVARERAATATQRAATHRLRVATGADLRSRLVTRVGAAADALRASTAMRRARALGDLDHGPTLDDLARAV